ncbi:Maf1-domain-containing protein [Clavulina sp. PMI_390]|nr:Maf1-domain-containing protein [Clavulina sp. PMI_390]
MGPKTFPPNSQLTTTSPASSLHARIEAYSCKATSKDKKLARSIDSHWDDEVAFKSAAPNHPSTASILDSPFGSLDQSQARKTFCLLIATLNAAFPDHDFSDISPDEFTKEFNGGAPILSALSNALATHDASAARHLSTRTFAAFPASYEEPKEDSMRRSASPITSVLRQLNQTSPAVSTTHPALFHLLNEVVNLSECEIYSYSPDVYSDPHGDDDSDEDSLASSDDTSDDGWAWDDYDVDEAPQYQSESPRKNSLDPWDLSSSPDREFMFPLDDEPKFKHRASSSYDDDFSPPSRLSPQRIRPSPQSSISSSGSGASNDAQARPMARSSGSYDWDMYESPAEYRQRRRSKGSLLWSSHWFFFHRKEKKILFITLWARQREWGTGHSSGVLDGLSSSWHEAELEFDERFGGWDGAVGAGARAFETALEKRTPSATVRGGAAVSV